ncbi:MAG: hypothetical protein KJ556_09750 [Gammaproteobacteria bacterium]|nr:hypothetical protein [Gammaproteobacteria bacterium]MBU2245694.1 hypothetical protein [Gammaproteobacteria bacterium]MBU2681742.1 hypothetical protein [Gammaproteobacteria bacterium]
MSKDEYLINSVKMIKVQGCFLLWKQILSIMPKGEKTGWELYTKNTATGKNAL